MRLLACLLRAWLLSGQSASVCPIRGLDQLELSAMLTFLFADQAMVISPDLLSALRGMRGLKALNMFNSFAQLSRLFSAEAMAGDE